MSTIAIENPGPAGATDDAQLSTGFARQPILNRDGMLCGYELKVRAPELPAEALSNAGADVADEAQAQTHERAGRAPTPAQRAASAIIHGLLQGNVRGALTGHPAYVDTSRDMLFDDAIQRLPAERFLFELSPDIQVDDELIARIVQLHSRRYRFVLDDLTQPNETFAKLLPYAEAIKIDVTRAPAALLPKLTSVLKSAGKLLIASGLDAQAALETAQELGFDRFQGYFFARPQTSSTRRVMRY
jgi:c-di-GMP-related signal transduction protein